MKKFYLLLITIFNLLTVNAQTRLSYQAIVRGASGELISGTNIGFRISIVQGSANGTTVFSETHTVQSNENGLTTLEIGSGSLISGNINSINWSNGPYFIKSETDPSGGTNYSIAGTSPILSVPHSIYAENSGTTVNNIQPVNGNISISKTDVGLANVDNTSDVNKPVSTAVQQELDLKADKNSPDFTGTPTAPTAAIGTSTNQIATTEFVVDAILDSEVPDANDQTKGKIMLAGDLAGYQSTADAPVISDEAITESKIAEAAVTETKINDLAVTENKIADNSITTDKINNQAVNADKIASSSITTDHIQDGAVSFTKIQEPSSTNIILGRFSPGQGPVEEISTNGSGDVVRNQAPQIDSPVFTGNPEAPTPAVTDNSASIATTSFVKSAISAAEIKNTPDPVGLTLSANESGKIIPTQWGGWPVIPENLPVGFTCTIINYSNYPNPATALTNVFYYSTQTGWNNGAGTSSFSIPSGGTVKLSVIEINGQLAYFITGDIM